MCAPLPTASLRQDSYFVVEHQPSSCDQYPANGNVVFEDIHIELEVSGCPHGGRTEQSLLTMLLLLVL